MANKIKRAIKDSKRTRDFKFRQKGRKDRENKKSKLENDKYVQRGSKGGNGFKKGGQPNNKFNDKRKNEEQEDADEPYDSEEEYKRVMDEEDPELERELAESGLLGDGAVKA